jgi:hypothetical protein
MPETYVEWGINFDTDVSKDYLTFGALIQSINWNGKRATYLQINLIFGILEIGKIIKTK